MKDFTISYCSTLEPEVTSELIHHAETHMRATNSSIEFCDFADKGDMKHLLFNGVSQSIFHDHFNNMEGELKIVLTSLQISSKYRIISCQGNNSFIISFWNLDLSGDIRYLSSLIYACYCIFLYKTKDSSEHSGSCLLAQSMYLNTINQVLCDKCTHELPYHGALVSRALHGMIYSAVDTGQVVIIQHGIRTYGHWYDQIIQVLSTNIIKSRGFRYGRFGLIKLFLNSFFKKEIKKSFLDTYHETLRAHPGAEISVITHSFGALLLSELLQEDNDLYLDCIILINSIVPENYDWGTVLNKGRVRKVLNECGGKDVLPILAKKVIWNAGSSGTLGFRNEHEYVINNFHPDATHSDLLNSTQCEENWIPFLIDNSSILKVHTNNSSPSKFVEVLDAVPSFFYCIIILAVIIISFFGLKWFISWLFF